MDEEQHRCSSEGLFHPTEVFQILKKQLWNQNEKEILNIMSILGNASISLPGSRDLASVGAGSPPGALEVTPASSHGEKSTVCAFVNVKPFIIEMS